MRLRFRREYLSELIARSNINETRKVRVGDIVLIGDDHYKRIDWPLERVQELIAGRDGVLRVAVLKIKDEVLWRPIHRVFPLEISDHEVEESAILREKVKTQTKKPDEQIDALIQKFKLNLGE